MRSSLTPVLAAVLLGAAPMAHAQSDVTTTLMQGGEPLIFSGSVKWPQADRYFVLGRQGARLTARLTRTNSRFLIAFVPGDADLRDPRPDWTYADALDLRIPANGRYAVAVLFDPRIDFAMPPPPASYRLELRME